MDRYICPPWYNCNCEPGMPVSLSTMKRHRKEANQVRAALGRGRFKRGPKVTPDMIIPYQFPDLHALQEHDTDDECIPHQNMRARSTFQTTAHNFRTGALLTTTAEDTVEATSCAQEQMIQHSPQSSPERTEYEQGAIDNAIYLNTSVQEGSYEPNVSDGDKIDAPTFQLAQLTASRFPAGATISSASNEEGEENQASQHHGIAPGDIATSTGSSGESGMLHGQEQPGEGIAISGGQNSTHHDMIIGTEDGQGLNYGGEYIAEDVSRIPGFLSWLRDSRDWVDLYQAHGLQKNVMNHILRITNAPCKRWETVIENITKVTGLQDSLQVFDSCPGHSCLVNLRGREGIPSCTICGISRSPEIDTELSSALKPVTYIPILPRLAKLVRNEDTCNELYSYLHDSMFEEGVLSDFFGIPLHKEFISSFGGEEQCRYDVFLTVSTDGFQVYKNKQCDFWPVLAVLMKLPPTQRYAAWNIFPLMFISGGLEPKDLQSFLIPLVNELKSIYERGGAKLKFFDGVERVVRIHLVWFTTDLAALRKVASLTGVKGKTPCRFCDIQGLYIPAAKGYYFPSWVYMDDDHSKRKALFDIRRLPTRTPQTVEDAIAQLEQASTQRERELISRETGIKGKSVICEIPGVTPFTSFPPDIMHLFYNVQRLLLKIFLGDIEGLSISDRVFDALDQELLDFGEGLSGQMSPRPRKLSEWRNWKSAEHKAFTLCYSLIIFDGHLPRELMKGLSYFSELADICFRYSLSSNDIDRASSLAIAFVEHYEAKYTQHKESRAQLCTYVIHLLLHLAQAMEKNGPLICCSQYSVEKYLGWISHRLHARYLPAESFTKASLFTDSYKIFYGNAFRKDDRDQLHEDTFNSGGFKLLGAKRKLRMTPRIRRLLSDYLVRKFSELDVDQAHQISNSVITLYSWKRVRFVSGGGTEVASVFQEKKSIKRPSHFLAVEMDSTEESASVYYGRILKIISFRIESPPSESALNDGAPPWNGEHNLLVIDWALDLVKGGQNQIFQSCARKNAFRSATVEDISILRRLIGVVEHLVPSSDLTASPGSQSTRRRGRVRTYFIDMLCREQHLLSRGRVSLDGCNRILKGF